MDVFHRREHRLVLFFTRAARFFLYAALILVPIAYFPWAQDALEMSKQLVLVLCAISATLSWLGVSIVERSISYKKSAINVFLVLGIVALLISTVTSLAPYTSFFGFDGQEYGSLLTALSVSLLFFVGLNVINESKTRYRAMEMVMIVLTVIMFFGVLSVFGVNILEENLIGTPNAMGIVAAGALVMMLAFFLFSTESENREGTILAKATTILSGPLLVLSFIVLYGLDYWFLWALVVLGSVFVMATMFLHGVKDVRLSKIILLSAVFVLSCVFMFVPVPGGSVFPIEIAPTYSSSYGIAKDALLNNGLFFGSGPGTFEIDYHQHKSGVVNQTEFWDINFNRSGSHLMTLLAGGGLISFIVYVLFGLAIFVVTLSWLIRTKKHDSWFPIILSFLGCFTFGVSQLFYSASMTTMVLMWLFAAMAFSVTREQMRTFTFKKTPAVSLGVSICAVISAMAIVTIGFMSLSRCAADVAFARALEANKTGGSIDEVITDLEKAAMLNKWSDVYARHLSYALLVKSGELLADEQVNPETTQAYVANAIYYAQHATELAPNTVANFAMLGDVYREVSPFVTGADVFAIEAYERAIALSPTNPTYLVNLGRARITQADLLDVIAAEVDTEVAKEAMTYKEEVLSGAVNALIRAVDMKPDYSVAQYYLALAYERQGNLSDAIDRLLALQSESPYDSGLAFQLGVLYLQQGKMDEAQEALEYVLELTPDYSNARWLLSSVLEQEGDLEGAIAQVEKILQDNPDNELVINRLEHLRSGMVTEEVVEPLEGAIIE